MRASNQNAVLSGTENVFDNKMADERLNANQSQIKKAFNRA